MAADGGSGKEPLLEKSCDSCNRGVKGNTKCVKCDKKYHPACAVRVSGIKVIGSDMVLCPACRENDENAGGNKETIDVIEHNEILTKLVLQMQVNQELLQEKIWMLEDRIQQYENGISNSIKINQQKTYATMAKNLSTPATSAKGIPAMSLQGTRSVAEIETTNNKGTSSSSASSPRSEVRNKNVNSYAKRNQNVNKPPTKAGGSVNGIIDDKSVNSAIIQAEMAAKMTEIINLGDNQSNQTNGKNNSSQEWRNVQKKRRRKFVVGLNENGDVQAVPKFTSLHVTRLHPNTTTDELEKFLASKFSNVNCEKHPSRYPQSYTSMKVTILREDLKNAWRRENWPKGAIVSHFMKRRVPSPMDPQVKEVIVV